ncbi:MAG: ABC transporter permease [Clostridiales bacterium]|nr:ABC transporter permease [Clostridiales bacterium]
MHLFKNFFKLLKNNSTGVIIYAVIFVAMVIGVMVAAPAMASETSGEAYATQTSMNITYVDYDDSELSRGLIDYLSVNNEVTDVSDRSESSIQNLVFFGLSEYHLTIEEGFGNGTGDIKYLTDMENSGAIYMIDLAVNNYIQAYKDYEAMGYEPSECAEHAKELVTNTATLNIVEKDDGRSSTSAGDVVIVFINQFFPYLALGFMTLGIGHTVIANNNKLIGDRIECSPVNRKKISFSNSLGIATSGVVLWIVFMLINVILGFAKGSDAFREYWWLLMINSFLTTLISCAFASFVTSFDLTSNSLSMVTNIAGLSMAFMSGVFVPQYLLGEGLLNIAKFMPMYWCVYASNMVDASTAYEPDKLLMCFGIEILFAVAFTMAAAFVKSSGLGKARSAVKTE